MTGLSPAGALRQLERLEQEDVLGPQRRKARYYLFHGTILVDFDLELVGRVLRAPSKEPDYRARRSHREFIRNVPVSRAGVKAALCAAWNAHEAAEPVDAGALNALIEERYGRDEWNLKF